MAPELSRRHFLVGFAAVAVAAGASRFTRSGNGPRVMVVHGLGLTVADFRSDPVIDRLTGGLSAQGWSVDVPVIDGEGSEQSTWLRERFDTDPTGASVRDQWLTHLARIPAPDLIVGISWGGLLALHAAAATGIPYAALLPAADPTELDEFAAYPLDALEITGLRGNGYMAWVRDDDRVGWETAHDLAMAAGCVRREYQTGGHVLTETQIDDVLAWADGLREEQR